MKKSIMKKSILVIAIALVALAQTAQADFSQTFTVNAGIPDGSLVGWSDTRAVPVQPGNTLDVNVTLNLGGGWNGDLYAYLVHNTGFAVLLNRVGRETGNKAGYGDAGMNVKLDDQATRLYDIHFYQKEFGYQASDITGGASWKPDGRNISPLSSQDLFTVGGARDAVLGSFNNQNAGGNWTLFIADVSGGDVSTLTSWTLEIAAVPEPASLIEGAVAALFLGGAICVFRLKGKKVQLPAAA